MSKIQKIYVPLVHNRKCTIKMFSPTKTVHVKKKNAIELNGKPLLILRVITQYSNSCDFTISLYKSLIILSSGLLKLFTQTFDFDIFAIHGNSVPR